ncbi:uncharacterized protein LTR77_003590 [Saxophila tyrrhenica]|uniref:Uncharacterized protein n=1 Tax=Saxophila tyrrhenica TaxID=1690608 RepID=A0AAV9PE08_9PEZI|nr:hypothetical protein LTR77_003590 [Saxophila tyrrhenica]
MASYFVTGANRGIGLELTKQLSELPATQVSKIFAAIRSSPPHALQKLVESSNGRVVPVQVQVTDRSSIDKAANEVAGMLDGKGLDVLINNAGILPLTQGGIEKMPEQTLRDVFDVNVVAVHNVIAGLLPLLRKGEQKKIITVYVFDHIDVERLHNS